MGSMVQPSRPGAICLCVTRMCFREAFRRRSQEKTSESGICAVLQETVDPELKAAMQCELRAEDPVLPEDQRENADTDAQESQRAGVAERRVEGSSVHAKFDPGAFAHAGIDC